MAVNRNDRNYEELYTELLGRGEMLHESNKRRIRRGIITLVILPFILEFIRWITDSDKVVFLIIWILIMFVLSAYLISIEYLDYTVEEALKDVTDIEADFDGLLPKPELRRADLHERISERFAALRAQRLGDDVDADADAEADEDEDADTDAVTTEETEHKVNASGASGASVYIDTAAEHENGSMELEDAIEQLEEVREAEEAMEELRETAPAEIIAAMKEVFDADMQKCAQTAANAADGSADEADSMASDAGKEDEK